MNFAWENRELLFAAQRVGAKFCQVTFKFRKTPDNKSISLPMVDEKYTKVEFFQFDNWRRLTQVYSLLRHLHPILKKDYEFKPITEDTFEITNKAYPSQLIYLADQEELLHNYNFDLVEKYWKISNQLSVAKQKDDSDFMISVWDESFKSYLTKEDISSFLKYSVLKKCALIENIQTVCCALTNQGIYEMPPIAIDSSGGDLGLMRAISPYEIELERQRGSGSLMNNPVYIKDPSKYAHFNMVS